MNKIGFAYDEVTSFMQTMTGAVLIRSQSHCYQHVACLMTLLSLRYHLIMI